MIFDKSSQYNNYIDESIIKINKKEDIWCSSTKFDSYKRYTQNGFFESINEACRLGYTDDFLVIEDIKNLDSLFDTLPLKMRNSQKMEVYRGTNLFFDIETALSENNGNYTFTDKGFVSTSKSLDVAKNFAILPDKVILHITIPPNSIILDDEKLQSSNRSAMKNEREVLLPRNSQFKITSYNPETKIAEAIYLGQKAPACLPKLTCSSKGADNLASMNKEMFLNPINKEKYNGLKLF